jgi:uncharacterized RDD family membrane protein YckC
MVNDSIREELQANLTVQPRTEPARDQSILPQRGHAIPYAGAAAVSAAYVLNNSPSPEVKKRITASLQPAKTNPTLVRLQDRKNDKVPEWRLKLKESVNRRKERGGAAVNDSNVAPMPRIPAAAVEKNNDAAAPVPADDRLAKALARIERSRRIYASSSSRIAAPAKPASLAVQQRPAPPPLPVTVSEQGKDTRPATSASENMAYDRINVTVADHGKDTNRLPKIGPVSEGKVDRDPHDGHDLPAVQVAASHVIDQKVIHIPAANADIVVTDLSENEIEDELDDLAPLSMRFAAGLFDAILSMIAASIILSPLVFYGFDWMNLTGLFLFAATTAFAMFVYSTLTLGFWGKTLGLRIFALELVDADENEYPTMRQAAINSSLYIVSMLFLGIGFVTVFFNDENRAAHDLLSGTILVKEF